MRPLILLCLGPALLAQVQTLHLTGLTNPTRARILLVNAKGDDCTDTIDLRGAETVKVAEAIAKAKTGRPCWANPEQDLAGIIVLAPGHASAYLSGAPLLAPEATIQLQPRQAVRVEVWPAADEFALAAHDDLANLDWILDHNRTGLTLQPHFNPPNPKVATITCQTAETDPDFFKAGSINLYYGGGEANESCGGNSAVLVHNIPVLGDAAHEIGHKLGLNTRDSDSQLIYFQGHTTKRPHFSCQNVMWEKSEVLKEQISLGQAAWLGLLADPATTLKCPPFDPDNDQSVRSPCPRFTVGQPPNPRPCPATCSAETVIKNFDSEGGRLAVRAPGREPGRSRLCTPDDLRKRLQARYRSLRHHVRHRPDLALSTPTEAAFVDWWMSRIQTIVVIEATWDAHQNADPELEKQGLAHLSKLSQDGPLKNHSYLDYARDKIKTNAYSPRCKSQPAP